MVFEILGRQRERAIGRTTNQFAHLLHHRRTPVRGQAHDFVLVFVNREAEIRGEGRVQHSERMRVADFTEQRDRRGPALAALAMADGQGRPLADTIRGEDRCSARRRGEKRGRGM